MKSNITTDGKTVWVNSEDGSSIGRFGALGVDIHRSATEQLDGKGECLLCTHGRTGPDEWKMFVEGMMSLYGITIAARYMPQRLRVSNNRT